MPFKKGQVPNPKGRGKGTLNKTTAEMKDMLNAIMEKQWPEVEKGLRKLAEEDPIKYVDVITKYFPYVIPKKVDVTTDNQPLKPEIKITVKGDETKGEIEKLDTDD